jgi:hypothetical protein
LVETTDAVYEVPLVKPVQAAVTPVTTQEPLLGLSETVYPVAPAPAVHERDAEALPAVAKTADAGANGVEETEDDAVEVSAERRAFTVIL